VLAVTVSATGSVGEPVTLLHEDSPREGQSIRLAIASNGASFLLAGDYLSSIGSAFFSRFDSDLAPIDPFPRPAGVFGGPQVIKPFRTSFVIGWSGLRPRVSVVTDDGRISPPVPVDILRQRGAGRP
jgi:hypothetical protein